MATAWLFHDSLVRQARLSRQPSCYRVNLCHLIGLLIASPSNVLICGLLPLFFLKEKKKVRLTVEIRGGRLVTRWGQEDRGGGFIKTWSTRRDVDKKRRKCNKLILSSFFVSRSGGWFYSSGSEISGSEGFLQPQKLYGNHFWDMLTIHSVFLLNL